MICLFLKPYFKNIISSCGHNIVMLRLLANQILRSKTLLSDITAFLRSKINSVDKLLNQDKKAEHE